MTDHVCTTECTRQNCKVFDREYMRGYRKNGPQVRGKYQKGGAPKPKRVRQPKPKPIPLTVVRDEEPKQPRGLMAWSRTIPTAMTLEEYRRVRDPAPVVRFVEAKVG